ncbi:CinA family protein [Aquincola sp. S2]|uniref:CinA family protein n=1 Tax=Pseudaquabacterium terrae TaxID=2732868 RepID=A0ABX2EHX3_9BURK|nr:CinA family protein [Aquabacterium terrae]NRF68200.1 CinA family protein [Aquabacterium terrae]
MSANVTEAEADDETRGVARFLRDRSLRLVTAESCTGGLIAAMLADLPGAGEILDSAFVVYSPQAKQSVLGVRKHTIDSFNLTSEAVAREMALGALRIAQVNLSIANTGVADPVDPRIPAGTQCFAWIFRFGDIDDAVYTETKRFEGDRTRVRREAARYALRRIAHYCAQTDRRR